MQQTLQTIESTLSNNEKMNPISKLSLADLNLDIYLFTMIIVTLMKK